MTDTLRVLLEIGPKGKRDLADPVPHPAPPGTTSWTTRGRWRTATSRSRRAEGRTTLPLMNTPLAAAAAFYEALDADDVPRILAACTEDATVHYPAEGRLPYGGVWMGRDGVAAFLDAHDLAEEILAFDVQQMLADVDTVVVVGSFTGRTKPGGREWSTPFVHALAFSDGLLRRWEAFFDTVVAVEAHADEVRQRTSDH